MNLKPCPFCGGDAYIHIDKKKNGTFNYVSVECKKCGAVPYVMQAYFGYSDEIASESVVDKWNKRKGSE